MRHAPREAVVGDVVASNIPYVFINVIEYKFTYVVSRARLSSPLQNSLHIHLAKQLVHFHCDRFRRPVHHISDRLQPLNIP